MKFETKAMSSLRTEFCSCTTVGFGKISRIKQDSIQRFKPGQAILGHYLEGRELRVKGRA